MASQLWVDVEDLNIDDLSESEYAPEACKMASYIMWGLSGRKFTGTSTVTERYVRGIPSDALGMSTETTFPVFTDSSEITNISLDGATKLKLRGRPVQKILGIRSRDGVVMDPDSYYLVEHSSIIFPNMFAPYDIEVTYVFGAPPPVAGKMAARELAMELVRSWQGDENCALPQRVTSVTRQGISFTILDNQDFLEELRTGIYTVDLFLKTVNPDKARSRSRVFSPDLPRARRPVPKPLVLAPSVLDASITRSGSSITFPTSAVGGDFLLTETGWTLEAIARSWGGTRSVTLVPGSALVNVGPDTITVSFGYSETLSALGMVDPGTWDLYAKRGSDPSTYLGSGNIRMTAV